MTATTTWKPSREEAALIRQYAAQEAGCASLKIEVGSRANVMDPQATEWSINIARVSDYENFSDTDLADMESWQSFRDGVELTDDGRALVDFYLYSRGVDSELLSNLTVWYQDGELKKIAGTSRTYLDLGVSWPDPAEDPEPDPEPAPAPELPPADMNSILLEASVTARGDRFLCVLSQRGLEDLKIGVILAPGLEERDPIKALEVGSRVRIVGRLADSGHGPYILAEHLEVRR